MSVPGVVAAPPPPVLTADPASSPPGATVTITGNGFQRFKLGVLSWDGSTAGMPVVMTDGDGFFATLIVVPFDAAQGLHTVVADVGRAVSSTTVQVSAPGETVIRATATTRRPTRTPTAVATSTSSPTASPTATGTATGTPVPTASPTATATSTGCPSGQYLAEYFNNDSLSGTPTFHQCETAISHNWGLGGPGNGVGVDHFSARWTGRANFSGATYAFSATVDDGIRLWIDGAVVLDAWRVGPAAFYQASRTLTAGDHDVKVEYFDYDYDAIIQLDWQAPTPTSTATATSPAAPTAATASATATATPPAAPTAATPSATATGCLAGQYVAQYYNNTTLTGTPVLQRCEAAISYNWGSGGPGSGVNTDGFSARWTGRFTFATGSTAFTAVADDGIRVWLDAALIIDSWKDQPATSYQATQTVAAGGHDVKVEYYENAGNAVAQVSWSGQTTGFVGRSGAQLTLNGQAYRFTGVNSYEIGTDWNINPGCGGQISDTALDAFFASLRPNSMVRFWAFQQQAYNKNTHQIDFTAIDRVVNAAGRHGQRVIMTIGNHWVDCDAVQKDEAWYASGYLQVINPQGITPLSYWDYLHQIVPRYASSPVVGLWEPMNEPETSSSSGCSATAGTTLRQFFDAVGGEIHRLDPNHLVGSGVIGSGQCGMAGSLYQYIHQSPGIDLASYHDYNADNTALPSSLQQDLTQVNTIAKPLIVGEAGVKAQDNSPGCTTLAQRRDLMQSKMNAQFQAGIDGFLPWDYVFTNIGNCDFGVYGNDPLFTLLHDFAL